MSLFQLNIYIKVFGLYSVVQNTREIYDREFTARLLCKKVDSIFVKIASKEDCKSMEIGISLQLEQLKMHS